jgi:arginase
MEMISQLDAYASLEVAEVNPVLDDRNRTAEFAVEIIASSLGKRIL